jgi:hypothetical protein
VCTELEWCAVKPHHTRAPRPRARPSSSSSKVAPTPLPRNSGRT